MRGPPHGEFMLQDKRVAVVRWRSQKLLARDERRYAQARRGPTSRDSDVRRRQSGGRCSATQARALKLETAARSGTRRAWTRSAEQPWETRR